MDCFLGPNGNVLAIVAGVQFRLDPSPNPRRDAGCQRQRDDFARSNANSRYFSNAT